MLHLTRLSGPRFALNPDLIERAEATPDTVITLVNGSKYVIRESVDELIAVVHRYRAELAATAQAVAAADAHPAVVPTRRTVNSHTRAHSAEHGTVVPLREEQGDV